MTDILCNFASCLILESHNLEIDLDLAADLAAMAGNADAKINYVYDWDLNVVD